MSGENQGRFSSQSESPSCFFVRRNRFLCLGSDLLHFSLSLPSALPLPVM